MAAVRSAHPVTSCPMAAQVVEILDAASSLRARMPEVAWSDFPLKCSLKVLAILDMLTFAYTEIARLVGVVAACPLNPEHRTGITDRLTQAFVQHGEAEGDSVVGSWSQTLGFRRGLLHRQRVGWDAQGPERHPDLIPTQTWPTQTHRDNIEYDCPRLHRCVPRPGVCIEDAAALATRHRHDAQKAIQAGRKRGSGACAHHHRPAAHACATWYRVPRVVCLGMRERGPSGDAVEPSAVSRAGANQSMSG